MKNKKKQMKNKKKDKKIKISKDQRIKKDI
jgi:hypothetical protein